MGGAQIQAVIAGIIVLVVSLVLFSPMTKGADVLYREFIPRCESGGDSSVKGTVTAISSGTGAGTVTAPTVGDVVTYTLGSTDCTIAPTTGGTWATGNIAIVTLVNEGGKTVVATHSSRTTTAPTSLALTGYKPVTPNENLNQFGSINRLVLSLLPLVIVVGFMSTSFMSIYQNRNSAAGGIAMALKAEITVLIVALIAIFVSPIALDYIGSSAAVVSGDTLSNTGQFGEIMVLLFGFMPVGLVLGIIGMIGWRAKSSYGNMRGNSGGGMLS